MLNQKVLVSGADFFTNDAHINPYYNQDPVSIQTAQKEHSRISDAFKEAGIEVVKVDPPSGCQDGVYTANWALVKNGKAIMARLPNARTAEEPYAESTLENLGLETITVPEDWHFSGQGDSLPCGKYLLAGSGYRSDTRAQEFAAKTLGLELIQLQTIPLLDSAGHPVTNKSSGWSDSLFYDIDLAISVINPDLIAYCKDAFLPESQAKIAALPLEKIEVSYQEAVEGFACNLVSTGETVIMSNNAPFLQHEFIRRGLKVITPDITELKKGGGYIRCVSLTLS